MRRYELSIWPPSRLMSAGSMDARSGQVNRDRISGSLSVAAATNSSYPLLSLSGCLQNALCEMSFDRWS